MSRKLSLVAFLEAAEDRWNVDFYPMRCQCEGLSTAHGLAGIGGGEQKA